MFSERCSVLTESVKSLEERLQQKTSELTEAQERYTSFSLMHDAKGAVAIRIAIL